MKTLVSAVLCLSLVGCAGVKTQPLSADTVSALDGKSVTLVLRESPSFVAMTSGKGMFAVAGVGAAAAAGNTLVEDANIEDPAPVIASELGMALTTKHGASVVGPSCWTSSFSHDSRVTIQPRTIRTPNADVPMTIVVPAAVPSRPPFAQEEADPASRRMTVGHTNWRRTACRRCWLSILTLSAP